MFFATAWRSALASWPATVPPPNAIGINKRQRSEKVLVMPPPRNVVTDIGRHPSLVALFSQTKTPALASDLLRMTSTRISIALVFASFLSVPGVTAQTVTPVPAEPLPVAVAPASDEQTPTLRPPSGSFFKTIGQD